MSTCRSSCIIANVQSYGPIHLLYNKTCKSAHCTKKWWGFIGSIINVTQKHNLKRKKLSKPRKALYVSQKYGNPGNLIWRGRRIHGLLKPIHIGRLIFIDIPYVSVSWQPPKYDIPLVSVRIALLQFAKALRFLHDSLHLDGFAFVNVSQKHNLKRKKLSKPRKALYVS